MWGTCQPRSRETYQTLHPSPINFRNIRTAETSNTKIELIANYASRKFVFIFMNEPANRMGCQVLTLEIRNYPHLAVLRCSGRIVRGDGADDLLRAAMSQDKRHLQIDLSGVESIDAGGLGVLAALEKWAKDGNRTIELINPSMRVRQALAATKLSSVLQVWPAIQDREDVA